MSNEAPSQLHGQSIADKVAKLAAFIGDDLDARAAHGLHGSTGGCYLLIARSPESPVAQALRTHAARIETMGIRVRAIFSEVEQGGAALLAPFTTPGECRIVRDQRLLAAHEQLSLSPAYTWVGDCMRREPSKRDALEHYAANCAQTGAHAARSFESLWRATAPLFAVPPLAAVLAQMPEIMGGELPDGMRRQ